MPSPLQRLRHDERGMSFVFVGAGFFAFLAATTLAIDVGMFMTARSQAQNAADAGALAGAVALVYNDYDDRSATGPAVQSAINTARTNVVIGVAPSVTPPDVTFPKSPAGLNNRVRVEVLRTIDRNRLRGAVTDNDVAELITKAHAIFDVIEFVALRQSILNRASQSFSTTLGTLDALHLATAL